MQAQTEAGDVTGAVMVMNVCRLTRVWGLKEVHRVQLRSVQGHPEAGDSVTVTGAVMVMNVCGWTRGARGSKV